MFSRILTWLIAGASAAIALATILGLFAPLDPRLEMPNHFRPFLLAASLGVFALSLLARRLQIIAAIPLLVSIALTLAPLWFTAASAKGETPDFRIVAMNLWVNNQRLAETAAFLRASKADVVVLQEVLCEPSDPLFNALRAEYPHQFRATDRCFGQAILSKHPLVATGTQNYKHRQPIWMWAEISLRGQNIRVTSVHLSHPTQPFDQVANVNTLASYARNVRGPHVMAGDFNLTPYSWLLNKLAYRSGMRRSGTYLASWPGHRGFPAFLIDHVFTSEDITRADFRVGPFAGSDHRPVVADLILKRKSIARSDPDRF